ncbi:MAG TPA: T9SS type A sorting domain-containing protein [Rubricoccaceae bacterium]|jgi:hypothetical protein
MRPTLLSLLATLGLALPASAQGTVTVGSGTLTVGSGTRLSTPYSVTVTDGAALITGDPATGGTLALSGGSGQTVTAATLGNVALTGGTTALGADLALTGVLTAGGGTLAPGTFTLRLAPTVANAAIVRLAALAGDGSTLGGPVTFERPHLDGEGWRMIAAPLATTFQSLNDDFLTQGATGATYEFGQPNVFAWDPSQPAASRYIGVTDFTQPMASGRGYFLYAYATQPGTGTPLLPTVWDISGAEPAGAVTVPLTASTGEATFNLLGNPYAAPLDWHSIQPAGGFAATYAVWDPAASAYAYYSSAGVASGDANRHIPAAQGFWAEATASTPPTLTFDRAWKAPTGSPVYVGRSADEAVALQLRLHLVGEGLTATDPVALFLDGGADGPDGFDASWLAPLAADYAAAYFVREGDGRALVFEARPVDTQPALRLAVEATRAGSYTLSWPGLEGAPSGPLTLVDLVTGERTDLRAQASYTFTLAAARPAGDAQTALPAALASRAQTVAPRFEVTVGRAATAGEGDAPVTALELVSPRPNPTAGQTRLAFALPKAGPVQITVVDLLGRTVAVVADASFAVGQHEITFDASQLSAGVYAVRLDAGGEVRTGRLTVAR